MPYILALDQGTTSSRAIVFDQGGGVRGVAQAEFRQLFPQPGWVEHDAVEIWATQSGVMREALVEAGVAPRDIAAIGITNQRETTMLWDATPAGPSPTPSSGRTGARPPCATHCALRAMRQRSRAKTGLVLDAYFSGTKMRWLLDNVPARARAGASSRSAPSIPG